MKKRIKNYLAATLKDQIFRRFVKNSGYLLCGNSMYGLLTAVQNVILARILGIREFGMLGIIVSMVYVLSRLYSFRMEEFLMTYYTRFQESKEPEKTCNVVQIAYLCAILTAVLAWVTIWAAKGIFIKLFLKNCPVHPGTVMTFAVSLIFINLSMVAEALLRLFDAFGKLAFVRATERAASIVLLLLLWVFEGRVSLQLVVMVFILASAIRVTTAHFYVLPQVSGMHSRWYQTPLRFSKKHIREYGSFLFQSGLSSQISNVTRGADELWLGFFATPAAVGLYKIAMSVACFVLLPINQFTGSAYPEIARLAAARSIKSLQTNLKRMSLAALVYCIPAFAFCSIAGSWLIGLVYGQDFIAAGKPLVFLLVGTGFAAVFFWTRPLLLNLGMIKAALFINLLAMLLKVILMPVLVTRHQETGAAVCMAVCYVFIGTLSVVIGTRQLSSCVQKEE